MHAPLYCNEIIARSQHPGLDASQESIMLQALMPAQLLIVPPATALPIASRLARQSTVAIRDSAVLNGLATYNGCSRQHEFLEGRTALQQLQQLQDSGDLA
jgi:hypothetical protein